MIPFFATTAKSLEPVLADELREIGVDWIQEQRLGVAFMGSLEAAYRVCLWSRVANRVLLPIETVEAGSEEQLYDEVRRLPWLDHLDDKRTLAVDFTTGRSNITHSHFGALKTKDAIVDCIRDRTGARPSIDVKNPDVRVNVHVDQNRATVSIDLSGESLHRRGYRQSGGAAPLKENLAAALLRVAGWPKLAAESAVFLDPMCGSGTLPIEAAWIAARIAPGLLRKAFGFSRWKGHEPATWLRLTKEAEALRERDPEKLPRIVGYDADGSAVSAALANVEAACVRGIVHIERRSLDALESLPSRATGSVRGLLVTNPPYGERIGELNELSELYATLGDTMRRKLLGWHAAILVGNSTLAKRIGLRPSRRTPVFNGAIECRLLEYPIAAAAVESEKGPGWRKPRE